MFEQCFKHVWQAENHKLDFKYMKSKTISVDAVNFTLYYETLSTACRVFITGQLWKAFNAVGSITNIEVVPYGNANV